MLDAVSGVAVVVLLPTGVIGLFGRDGDHSVGRVVQFAGMMPFMFMSGAFAALAMKPDWLRTIAKAVVGWS